MRWNSEKNETARVTLLHGMGGTGAMWRPIAANLETDVSVLAPDQRGHGKSRPIQGGYTPLDFGQDVIDTLESQNFYPTFLVGHSMGVRTAVAAAYLRPEFVRGLVLVDLGFSGVAGGGMGDSLAEFMKILPQEFASRNEGREFLAKHCPDPAIAQYLIAVAQIKSQGIVFPFEPSEMIRVIEAAKNSSVRDWVKELAGRGMPILVLRGEKSGVFDRAIYESEQKALAGFKSVVFEEMPGVGHGLPFENRVGFVARLKAFIGSVV